jgi:sphingomyelin phosphodiesterase
MPTFVGPSITTASGNPAFRIYEIDPDTFEVMDFTEFVADLRDPTFDDGPTWKPYYSAREEYAPLFEGGWPEDRPLDAQFWHKVVDALYQDDEAFHLYQSRVMRYTDGRHHKAYCRTEKCKKEWLCQARKSVSTNPCKPVKAGLNIDSTGRRRSGDVWSSDPVFLEHVEGDDDEVEHTHVDAGLILRQTMNAAVAGQVSELVFILLSLWTWSN